MTRDLTVGEPGAVLRRFCLPLLGSVLFQQLYNVADSFVAGKFIGEEALAAVGNSYEITLIFLAFAFGCNVGCSVTVAQLFGGKRLGEMKSAVSTAMIATAALCALLMGAGLLSAGGLLAMIRTPENILADSRLYLDIYLYGLPFLFFYNVSNGIFSAMGDSRTPFLFLAASSTANIAVDILFVTAFRMGVAGVAWATFLCQGISCLLAVLTVFRRLGRLRAEEKHPVFSFRLLGRIARIAVPSTLQQSFISVGNILIQGMINGFGSATIAGYAAAIKLNNLVVTSFTTLGNGISNYTAQNLGAGRPDRIRAGFSAGLRMMWALCLPMALLYFFAGRPLVGLFMNGGEGSAMAVGVLFLRIVAPAYFIMTAKLCADGVLRGAGAMGRFMTATFCDLILRVVLAAVFSRTFQSSAGIWAAWPFGWTAGGALSLIFYFTGPWRKTTRREER